MFFFKNSAGAADSKEGESESKEKSDEEPKEKEKPKGEREFLYKVNGCVLTMINRLSTEFTKILQDSDCHSTDYVDK